MSAIDEANTYLADFGKVLYSPLATKAIIEGLLAELKEAENFIEAQHQEDTGQ